MNEKDNFLNFKRRNILITGSSGHIGKNMALTFSDLGANLILTDKDSAKLKKLKLYILNKNKDLKLHIFKCNLSKDSERKKLISFTKLKFNKIDCIINNAGVLSANFKSNQWIGKSKINQ